MVNYADLQKRRQVQNVINPIDIFKRLPKSEKIKDLFDIQRQSLQEWFDRRDAQDIVIKLNTGGGKTLVGLLIAQSLMREQRGPVLYLCPNWQLARQTIEKAQDVGINVHAYDRRDHGVDDPRFRNGESILVSPYQVLFNGLSKFGLKGQLEIVPLVGLILDDAHAALPIMRDQFTLVVDANRQRESYLGLAGMFQRDFRKIRKAGLLNDILKGQEQRVLEVPYEGWIHHIDVIRQLLQREYERVRSQGEKWDSYTFTWPLIRDELDVCHALINARGFTITPMYPLVDQFPSFTNCDHRVYMSATLPDDSAIIRTFNADSKHVAKPVMPVEVTNVGERMMLVPELTALPHERIQEIVKSVAKVVSKNAGTVILVPSFQAGEKWKEAGELADSSDKAADFVQQLQSGDSTGPFVLANRYDGMDLLGDSCRLLIISDLPKGIDSYDSYLSSILGESGPIKTTLAQRIEQGAGRATRGAGDYSVVLFVGPKLSSWIATSKNRKLFTQVTRAQLEMGLTISGAIEDKNDLVSTILQCLNQDLDWRRYHAEALAELADEINVAVDKVALIVAAAERRYFRLLREKRYADAVAALESVVNGQLMEDRKYIGWLLQLAARAAFLAKDFDKVRQLQKRAFKANRVLFQPDEAQYIALKPAGEQAKAIVDGFLKYDLPKAYLAEFGEIESHLTATVSAAQFEEALKGLGRFLGFQSQRPECEFDAGPDVLWIASEHLGFVIEAKSCKQVDNPLTKKEYGQLLTSDKWFHEQYEGYESIKVVVHPNAFADHRVAPGDTMVLTLDTLSVMVARIKETLNCLADSTDLDRETLLVKCNAKLEELNLKPEQLVESYLMPLRKE